MLGGHWSTLLLCSKWNAIFPAVQGLYILHNTLTSQVLHSGKLKVKYSTPTFISVGATMWR